MRMKKKVSKKPAAKKTAAKKKKEGARTPSVHNLITKDMGLVEVLRRFPQTLPVFGRYGIHCIGCSMSAFETVEQGARAHGIDVKKFVADLNAAAGSR
jgi:hybrid cluster-associated redox disulfide protein